MTDPQFYHATGNIRALWNPNGTMFNSSDAEFIQMKLLVCISDCSLMIKSGCDWRSWETLGMRRKHVALDDILGWRNQSDRLKNFAKLSLSAQSHLEPFWINHSFQWRWCFLHKCISSLHVTHVVLLIMSISAHATNKSSTTKILLCFYSNRHEEKINFHPHLQSEDLRTQKAQRLKWVITRIMTVTDFTRQ